MNRARWLIPNWTKMLVAILLGNAIYFVLRPILPLYLRHHLYELDPGLLLDFLICTAIYLATLKLSA